MFLLLSHRDEKVTLGRNESAVQKQIKNAKSGVLYIYNPYALSDKFKFLKFIYYILPIMTKHIKWIPLK
jgi:hypothetical protein